MDSTAIMQNLYKEFGSQLSKDLYLHRKMICTEIILESDCDLK